MESTGETPEQQLQRRVRTLEAAVWTLTDRLERLLSRQPLTPTSTPTQAPTLPLEVGIVAEPKAICRLTFARRDRFYTYYRTAPGRLYTGQIAIANGLADRLQLTEDIELLAVEKKGR